VESVFTATANFCTLLHLSMIMWVTPSFFSACYVLIALRPVHTVSRPRAHMIPQQRRQTPCTYLCGTRDPLRPYPRGSNARRQLPSSVTRPSSLHCPLSHHVSLTRNKNLYQLTPLPIQTPIPCKFSLPLLCRNSRRPPNIRRQMILPFP